jgi:hypothetical protein
VNARKTRLPVIPAKAGIHKKIRGLDPVSSGVFYAPLYGMTAQTLDALT